MVAVRLDAARAFFLFVVGMLILGGTSCSTDTSEDPLTQDLLNTYLVVRESERDTTYLTGRGLTALIALSTSQSVPTSVRFAADKVFEELHGYHSMIDVLIASWFLDDDPRIRMAAACLSSQLAGPFPSSLPMLLQSTSDPDPHVRAAGLLALLHRASWDKAPLDSSYVEAVLSQADSRLVLAKVFSALSIKGLFAELSSSSEQSQYVAARALAAIPASDFGLSFDLAKIYADTTRSPRVREAVVAAIVKSSFIPPDLSLEALERLRHPDTSSVAQPLLRASLNLMGRDGARCSEELGVLVTAAASMPPTVGTQLGEALARVATLADERRDISVIQQIGRAEQALRNAPASGSSAALSEMMRARRHLEDLRGLERQRRFSELLKRYGVLIVPFAIYAGILLLWTILLFIRPLLLLRLAGFLGGLIQDSELAFGPLTFSLPRLLGIDRFAVHERVLAAWSVKYRARLLDHFHTAATVSQRALMVPLPAMINGRLYASCDYREIDRLLSDEQQIVLLVGEGGIGKSSLAYDIARWAARAGVGDVAWLFECTPILIPEEDVDPTSSPESVLTRSIRLAVIRAGVPRIECGSRLVERLWATGRLLPVVDGVSEMHARAQDAVWGAFRHQLGGVVLVSSRFEPFALPALVIQPQRLKSGQVGGFVEAYLNLVGRSESWRDEDTYRVSREVERITQGSTITPLFTRMCIDRSRLSGSTDASRTGIVNVMDLVDEYIHVVCAGCIGAGLDESKVYFVLRRIAWESVRRSGSPEPLRWDEAIAACAELGDVGNEIAYLTRVTQMLDRSGGHGEWLRISLDPLGEYLGAMETIERNGEDVGLWEEWCNLAEEWGQWAKLEGSYMDVVVKAALGGTVREAVRGATRRRLMAFRELN